MLIEISQRPSTLLFQAMLVVFSLLLLSGAMCGGDPQSTFIVHVSPSQRPSVFSSHHHWHTSILTSTSASPSSILYSYHLTASGFSATLSPRQAIHLRRHPAVLSVTLDQPRQLHTTHTPTFLGLRHSSGLWPHSHYADDIIIAVLDTGIWPESPSFSDYGLPAAPPPSWTGHCTTSDDFPSASCNRKIIGAYAFYRGYEAAAGRPINQSVESKSPRDTDGHGTHTASTSAGSAVKNAALFGYAAGEARGMAARARLAIYKICWRLGCFDSDILAAMDQAVSDGVHVISLSVGTSGNPPPYAADSIAVGAFGAVKHNVLVSCSAGNSGPAPSTVVNIAPWILTVGASTVDREFPADVLLGDRRRFKGASLYSAPGDTHPAGVRSPLVDGATCGDRLCRRGRLTTSCAAGKIVVCERGGNARVDKGYAVKVSGGVGMVLCNTAETGEELVADAHLIPAAAVGAAAAREIKSYVTSAVDPTAKILFGGTVIGSRDPPAPAVAAFSSRGPGMISPEILKPDVVAPGVGILAGWTRQAGPTGLRDDNRRVDFNIISGTSMSCPHVSGIAALLRRAHPDWSPAAVKSAIVTTASGSNGEYTNITDLATGRESTPFVRGAGHIDPGRALDPGLVYDINPEEYVGFLRATGYLDSTIAVITGSATPAPVLRSARDLNYPSFSVIFRSANDVVTFRRKVTNVGDEVDVMYEAMVGWTGPFRITVSPGTLRFSAEEKTAEYAVTFQSLAAEGRGEAAGAVEWRDGRHVVRSQVAVRWELAGESMAAE